MEICAIICEFNPFHNGHAYLLNTARRISGCDAVLCIMSGSFTQRGDICVQGRFQRASHAVHGGADCVLELPSAFSVAPAEIFAKGAIKILSSIPAVKSIAFGCEHSDKKELLSAAELLLDENESFKELLLKGLNSGNSYTASYLSAFKSLGGNENLLTRPNDILAVEYIKAIRRANADIVIFPIQRTGADTSDLNLKSVYSSSGAIRKNLKSELIKSSLPPFVYEDIKKIESPEEKFKTAQKLILSRSDAERLKKIYGCTEGLENKLLSLATDSYDGIIEKSTSKRYPSSRIKRILCADFLNNFADETNEFLNGELYLRPLALKRQISEKLLSEISKSYYPLILKGRDREKLSLTARKCLEKDDFAAYQRFIVSETGDISDSPLFID